MHAKILSVCKCGGGVLTQLLYQLAAVNIGAFAHKSRQAVNALVTKRAQSVVRRVYDVPKHALLT